MSKVAIVETQPDTVLDDYSNVMKLVNYQNTIQKTNNTIIKLNLSWSQFYPACSTSPWQLDGVLKTLIEDGYNNNLCCVENQTVVTHPWKGAYNNKWLPIMDRYDIPYYPLTNEKWIEYKPSGEILVMYDIFGKILIPELFVGNNIIHLPTVKTHGHTTTTGSMKNAFGGLIPKWRHHAHKKIHEVLVDLLTIQKEIHSGIFAVMDGTVCGNGAGPRTMIPYLGNVLLASDDQVAIDAIAARMMGFDPLTIDYIRIAHDKGLGIGDIDQIEVVGLDNFKDLNFNFTVNKSPIIKWDQKLRKGTMSIPKLHRLLFHSPLFKAFIFASETYHDKLWYPTTGKNYIKAFNETGWGKLFNNYPLGYYPKYDEVKQWNPY
jgi:uncharacterized protein (DUF362 family)